MNMYKAFRTMPGNKCSRNAQKNVSLREDPGAGGAGAAAEMPCDQCQREREPQRPRAGPQ